jgi:hypothetical protein
MRTAHAGLMILLWLPAGTAFAQQQQQAESPADAARQAREQKKDQGKPAKVWDNDNIPAVKGQVNVVGQTSQSNADSSTGANTQDTAGTALAPAASQAKSAGKDVRALQADLDAAKERLQSVKSEYDILQRKYTLDAQMYYSKPNYSTDPDGGAKVDAEKAQMDAKKLEVDEEQKKVDKLQAELKDSGAGSGSGGTSNPPSTENKSN